MPSHIANKKINKFFHFQIPALDLLSKSPSPSTTSTVENDSVLNQIPETLSVIHISESVKDCGTDEVQEVPLAAEEEDHLSPLMMDNHTVLEHQESFKTSRLPLDVVDRVHEIPEFVPQQYQHPPNICDKKDSIGSIDSDVSMTFDGHHECSNPSGDSSDENAKDSGCDVNGGKIDEINVDEPIEVPDDDLAEKIVTQVEFYFSNENILKDAFLVSLFFNYIFHVL